MAKDTNLTVNDICKTLFNELGSLCDNGMDDYMDDTNNEWCENHCSNTIKGLGDWKCWKKYFETRKGEEQ